MKMDTTFKEAYNLGLTGAMKCAQLYLDMETVSDETKYVLGRLIASYRNLMFKEAGE